VLWGSYAGAHTAPVPVKASAMDLFAMLCAQPRPSHWRKQEEVERDLGLEEQAVTEYFRNLCGGTHGRKNYDEAVSLPRHQQQKKSILISRPGGGCMVYYQHMNALLCSHRKHVVNNLTFRLD